MSPKTQSLFSESNSSTCDPFFYEGLVRKAGYDLIAGVDEAGRGPLAGPVVAAAVIIPQGTQLTGIKDSKKMTEKAREKAFPLVHDQALATGIGVVSHKYIDEYNILRASLEAMKRAVLALDPQPEFLLVDGIQKVPLPVPQRCLKKGDQISRSISAASVVAKVYRDRIMRCYHEMHPVYDFTQNKGYGTRSHLEALKRNGPSPIHRLTFRGVLQLDKGKTRTWETW
ncbi:MAG: ribonuclease HII [Desulfobacteraceae bacterium]|nr:MAG: ribonuclease HII [Desulfobacteraceae bacterium]